MKKKIIFGLAMVGASVAVLGGCGGSAPKQETTTLEVESAVETTTTTTSVETVTETTEVETTYNSEGLSDLQLFYLSLNEKDLLTDVEAKASNAGYYVEKDKNVTFTRMWISEKETLGLGKGSESWYQYDTDSIGLFFDSNNELFSKDYRFQSKHVTVSNTFSDNETVIEDSISGEPDRATIDVPKEPFSEAKEAIIYVNNSK